MEFKTDLRQYLAIFLRWSWLLILAALLAGVVAYVVSSRQQPIYQASTTILIEEAIGSPDASEYQSILISERRALTYVNLLVANPLLSQVITQLNLPMGVNALSNAISVEPIRNTQLIRVRVQDTDPARAALIANTLVTRFAQQRQELQSSRLASFEASFKEQLATLEQQIQQTDQSITALGDTDRAATERLQANLDQYRQSYANVLRNYEEVRLAQAQSAPSLSQEEPAEVPRGSISPRIMRNTSLAALLGLVVAMVLVFVKEAMDDSVKNPDELSQQLGLPVLGLIAAMDGNGSLPIVFAQPRSPISEAFRNLRTNIQFASVDRKIRTLLVTSPSPNEGKSTVISNLAAVLAQPGQKVILIESDLRRPTLHKKLGLSNRIGMSDLFVQENPQPEGVLQPTEIDGLSAITSGELPPNPVELLGSEKMVEILNEVKEHADVVLVDTPPVLAVTDAVVLAQRVDGVLLVVRSGVTKMAAAKQAVDQLRFVGANPLGVVLNGIQFGRSRYGYGYSYHGYYYAYHQDDSKSQRSRWPWPLRKNGQKAKAEA